MDPRFKLQYYRENGWEDSMIQETKKQVVDLWKSTYKINNSVDENSDRDDNELFGHIFKKRKTENDELAVYLDRKVASSKTDILAWWKVSIIYILLFYYYFTT